MTSDSQPPDVPATPEGELPVPAHAPEVVHFHQLEREPTKIERSILEPYLFGSLNLSAVRWWEHVELLEQGLECYRYLAGRFYDRGQRGFTHLPLMLVVDLVILIELGDRTPFASEQLATQWPLEERRLRIDYENLLLGTLLQEPSFIDARERLTTDPRVRPGAVQRLTELLLQEFGMHYPQWLHVNPTHLRDVGLPLVQEFQSAVARESFELKIEDQLIYTDALRQMLRGISNNVYWKNLLEQEDLFEIEHWALLDSESVRIGVRQLTEINRRLGEFRLPRVRLQQEVMEVDTDFDDDTVYPTGGFAGLTNRGSFENLVRSELVYMSEGDGTISLFDLRFSENELLFYMRNDGVMRRRRRFVHILLDLDTAFHYKSPGYEYPFSTLTQGLITRLAHDLLQTFEEDAVTIDIHYIHRDDRSLDHEAAQRERERVAREINLLRLALDREIRQDLVHLQMVSEIDLDVIQHSKGRVYAVAFCFDAERERFWRELFHDLKVARPPVHGIVFPVAIGEPGEEATRDEVPLFLPMNGVSFAEVASLKNELFTRIVSGRG